MLKSKLISDFTILVNKYDGSYSKRCFDAFNNEIFDGDLLQVQNESVLRKVYKKEDGEFRKAEEESYRLRNKTNNESNFSDFSLNSSSFFNSDNSSSNDSDSSNSSDFSGDGGSFGGGGSSGEW